MTVATYVVIAVIIGIAVVIMRTEPPEEKASKQYIVKVGGETNNE